VSKIVVVTQLQSEPEPNEQQLNSKSLRWSVKDAWRVTKQQRLLRQELTSKLNILLVANSALLSFLAISELISFCNLFSLLELLALCTNFILILGVFVPIQPSVTPNLTTDEFVENYPTMEPDEYNFQMLQNIKKSYQDNQRKFDNIAQMLSRSAAVTGVIVVVVIVHIFASYLMLPDATWCLSFWQ